MTPKYLLQGVRNMIRPEKILFQSAVLFALLAIILTLGMGFYL